MKKTLLCVELILGLLLLNSGVILAEDNLSLDFIIAGIKNREANLKSISGNFIIETETPGMQSIKAKVFWALSGNKERFDFNPFYLEEKGKQIPPTEIEKNNVYYMQNAFDGEKTINFFVEQKTATIRYGRLYSLGSIFSPYYLGLLKIEEEFLSSCLKLSGAESELIGSEKIDGSDCYVISFYVVRENHPIPPKNKIWIDVRRGFTPLKYTSYNEQEKVGFIFSVSELIQYGEIWFPQRASYTAYTVNSIGEQIIASKAILSTEKLSVNEVVPDDVFTINLPSGTRVSDLISGINYLVP